ncbi:MAG: SDR family oxidoreductase [Myxococcaceae bacterium]|nr:SDR family oxidoreductase [Myxococcaceae bacterium]
MTPKPGMQRVLITGGGSGIGRAVAERVLAEGGQVVVSGRRAERLEAVVRSAPEGRAVAISCDLADPAQRRALVARAKAALGGLDGVVFSAGLVHHQLPGALDENALNAQLQINLVAALRIGEQALEHLDPGGALVFVSSTLAHRPLPTSAVYSASKAGLLAVMKSFALAGAGRRIRCNAVTPGLVDTEMISGRDRTALDALHPLGRIGRPEEIAEAIAHLLTASWTTGTELVVDGGLLLRE